MASLKAHVYRDLRTGSWQVDIDNPVDRMTSWSLSRASWAEAMQAAYLMLRDLDRLLMDQVHQDRASRRYRPTTPPLIEATA